MSPLNPNNRSLTSSLDNSTKPHFLWQGLKILLLIILERVDSTRDIGKSTI